MRKCFVAFLLLLAAHAVAQNAPYHLEKLAPGIHAVIREPAEGGASDSNVLIVVNDDDVVVVDSGILPTSAREVVREIRKITPLPVRYLINTHYHSDHHYGNEVYRTAYPGVEIVQHPATRDLVVREDIPALAKNLAEEYPAYIAKLRKALETGKRSNGEPVTPEQRKQFTESLGLYELFLADMGKSKVVPGTLTVGHELVLHRGERTIEIRFLGLGNTPGDLVVYLPKERILATGDLVVHPIPFAFSSFIREWPATLRELKKFDAATILPGHGQVLKDWSYVDRVIAVLESVWTQVQQAVASGKDLEATRTAVNVDAFREAFGGESQRQALEYLFVGPAIEAAYKQLRPGAATDH